MLMNLQIRFLFQIIDDLIDHKNKNADIEKKLANTMGSAFSKEEIDKIKLKMKII